MKRIIMKPPMSEKICNIMSQYLASLSNIRDQYRIYVQTQLSANAAKTRIDLGLKISVRMQSIVMMCSVSATKSKKFSEDVI